jgi:hypothetical protein
MSERKTDFFGTFLESMRSSAPSRPAEPLPGRPTTPPPVTQSPLQGELDPRNAVLKALRDGGRPAKDLIPLTGNSITTFLNVSTDLINLGWIIRRDPDIFELTDKGREVADILA